MLLELRDIRKEREGEKRKKRKSRLIFIFIYGYLCLFAGLLWTLFQHCETGRPLAMKVLSLETMIVKALEMGTQGKPSSGL